VNDQPSARKTTDASLIVCVISCAVFFAGCASPNAGGDVGFYLVNVTQTPMYRYGPAQSFGADFNLTKGQRVVMMRREYGYSRVMTDEGQSGYVATEDLVPAPPGPKPTPTANPAPNPTSARVSGGRPLDVPPLPTRGRIRSGPSSANSAAVLQGSPLFGPGDLPPLPENPEKPSVPAPKPEFRFPKPKPGFRVNVPTPAAPGAETKP
jgi:hypothetical protein